MPATDTILQSIASGAAAGALYGLIGLGFSLAYRTTGVLNFAQGEFVLLGGYLLLAIAAAGVPPGIAAILAVICIAALAAAIERGLLRPLYRLPMEYPILCTVAISLVLQNSISQIWGPQTRFPPEVLPSGIINIGSVRIEVYDVSIFVAALLCGLALALLIKRSRLGLGIRVVSRDRDVGALLGMRPGLLLPAAFALAGVTAAIAGVLIAPQINLSPSVGISLSIVGFTAAVLGGLGSMTGAIVGGLVIGIVENLAVLFIDPGYASGVTYVLLILVLVLRPWGLFGDASTTVRTI